MCLSSKIEVEHAKDKINAEVCMTFDDFHDSMSVLEYYWSSMSNVSSRSDCHRKNVCSYSIDIFKIIVSSHIA
jgi:hypothetical protein